ncbi:hypothetical protein V8C86DRAFT_2652313 [Haematococcus lacustris]
MHVLACCHPISLSCAYPWCVGVQHHATPCHHCHYPVVATVPAIRLATQQGGAQPGLGISWQGFKCKPSCSYHTWSLVVTGLYTWRTG